MRNGLWTEGLVIGIILLFIETSVIPGISSNQKHYAEENNLVSNEIPTPLSFTDPSWQWAKSGGGTSSDVGWDVAVDTNGSAYITGWFSGTATFGNTNLTGQAYYNVFVAKLSTSGAWQWAKSAGGAGYGIDVAVDANGNAYITGYFMGTATFGSTILTSQGNRDVFVAKLSTSGAWQWAVSAGGTDLDEGGGVVVDPSGNIYITGSFNDVATFGNTNLTSYGGHDVFVAKLTTNGAWQWAVSAGGTDFEEGKHVAVDVNGDVYIVGVFYDWALFGSTNLTSYGSYDVFVAKLTTNGAWQWAVGAGGTGGDIGKCVAVDTGGNVYTTGYFTGTATFGSIILTNQGSNDMFVAKLTTNGGWQWATSVEETDNTEDCGVVVDPSGNIYITGDITHHAFVAKLSMSGAWQWTVNVGGTSEGWGVAVDANGNAYITGWFSGTATFGNTNLTSQGNRDVFVAKLSQGGGNQPPNPPTITGPAKGKIKVPTTYNFTTTDPEDNNISYFIDWGDGTNSSWIGSYPSGDVITQSHTWTKKGTYTIKAKAKDSYGNESGWGTLSVTMPCSYNIPFLSFWERLFERFQHAFPILRHLLGY